MKKIVRHPEPLMKAREELAYKFYESILEPDEYPESVLDDDSLSSVCSLLEEKMGGEESDIYLRDKIIKAYGVDIGNDSFSSDFWQILDVFEESLQHRINQKNQKFLPKS